MSQDIEDAAGAAGDCGLHCWKGIRPRSRAPCASEQNAARPRSSLAWASERCVHRQVGRWRDGPGRQPRLLWALRSADREVRRRRSPLRWPLAWRRHGERRARWAPWSPGASRGPFTPTDRCWSRSRVADKHL